MPRPVVTALTRSLAQSDAGRALPSARAAVDTLSGQLATGYRVNRPSDDPGAFTQARALGRVQDRLAQYHKTIDAATLWTDRTQSELDGLADLFSEANEIGLRARNGVLSPEDLAVKIDSLRDEAIARLNAESGGEHLFAGNQTDTAPIDASGAIAAGDFGGQRRREIAPGLSVTINATEALRVDGVAAPDVLQALADAVRSGDDAAMASAIDGVQAATSHYIELGGRSGAVSQTLRAAREAGEDRDVQLDERRAALEEVDLADVLGALQRRQTGLEAALRATAATAQTTLLDYLR